MAKFVALLRGVNVGGKVAKMDAVRAAFEGLGFTQVRTYVQSGNVLFEAKAASETALAKKIAAALEKAIGFSIAVRVCSLPDLARAVAENPFLKDQTVDPTKLHVTFLDGVPAAAGLEKMQAAASPRERIAVRGAVVYLYCPDGYGRSKLTNNAFERALKLGATTRNWNTVTTLARMIAEAS